MEETSGRDRSTVAAISFAYFINILLLLLTQVGLIIDAFHVTFAISIVLILNSILVAHQLVSHPPI